MSGLISIFPLVHSIRRSKNPPSHRRASVFPILPILLLLLFVSCNGKEEVVFVGESMGTTWHVKVVRGAFQNTSGLKKKIGRRLEEINRSMSTYRKESEISRFNATSGEPMAISEDFFRVMTAARRLHRLTGGAWDGTVKPLVDAWGFRGGKQMERPPDAAEIRRLLQQIGFHEIAIHDDRRIAKKRPEVTLDLGSVAKGYGVDRIAALLLDEGFDHFLVEIGGEVRGAGFRIDGGPWRVGVNRPEKGAALDAVHTVVPLHEKSIATSGDYRKFFEMGGKRYSHVLDPGTGFPVDNGVVSVSIITDSCTFADGLATAVMVMGREKGLALVERLDDTEAMVVVRRENGALTDFFSSGFPADGEP